jgi:RNA polymerase sigma factor (TIGR02999 family)
LIDAEAAVAGGEAITRWLAAWRQGDRRAPEELLPLVYRELQRLARGYLRKERTNRSLETSALVHEAYLKLLPQRGIEWADRHHFYGIAAQAMRRLLVDAARRRRGAKRGGGRVALRLDRMSIAIPTRPQLLVDLDEALAELETVDPEAVRIVELRVFAGLPQPAVAAALGVSLSSVERRWRVIRAWLHGRLRGEEA